MTGHLICISRRCGHNVTTGYGLTNKLSYLSCQCHYIIFMHVLYNQNLRINYLNGTFNQVYGVDHLINQFIARFKHGRFSLLLSGLKRTLHIFMCLSIVLFFRICIVAWKEYRIKTLAYMKWRIGKTVVWFSHLCFICFWFCIKFITNHLSIFLASFQNLESIAGFVGGGRSARINYEHLKPYIVSTEVQLNDAHEFSYIYSRHCTIDNALQEIQTGREALLVCNIPLAQIANILTSTQATEVAKEHNLIRLSRKSLADKRAAVESHVCTISCNRCVTIFKPVKKNKKSILCTKRKEKKVNIKVGKKSWGKPARAVTNHKYYVQEKLKFPPSPPSRRLMHKIISGFCNDTHPCKFEEAGCAVCGQLVVMTKLIKLSDVKCSLDPLVHVGVTRLPRKSVDDPIKEIEGPIIDANCKHVCLECVSFLEKKKMPPMALANGLWVGNVPKELSDLTFVERLLVSRVRSNRCIVHVLKGGWKMRANAIMFPTPVPKLCNILPPPIEELDEVIAFMFTGVAQPTAEDMKRTPMLARQRYISAALEWLKINHSDYADVQISQENLKLYPEEGPPVTVDYRSSIVNKHKEATSVFDMEDEDGVLEGKCSFVVHGITGETYSTLSKDATRALALQHLIKDQNILFVGHGTKPESMFNNSRLFPSMMPWLFPYGLGGIGNSNIIGPMSSISQKKHLLMYHDKRFQTDPGFPLIAFNQEQIQQSSSAGFVTAEKPYFAEVAKRLMNLDKSVLEDITDRMMKGERVKPETDAEIACFRVLSDVDTVGGRVKGSLTSKKYMRNNVWSLISYVGAPSWFITLSPADINHPICIYFANKNITFKPELYFKKADDAYRLVTSNPVAAARFFHLMCHNFIKHVLGFGKKHAGLYGQTKAFYGTVEQQGRLTLHLHMLIWIKGALSPQEVRDKILDTESDFQKSMVEYLESVHQGEFFDGKLEDVIERIDGYQKNPEYVPPTKTMPEAPPPLCMERIDCNICENCKALTSWWAQFKIVVDDLVKRSNRHNDCSKSVRPCLRKGRCKARFPRDIVETTMVDPATGALKMKKGEAWINYFSPLLTFVARCNTDTTSLLSGTAIKATVAYITDYVTKPGLNTYSMFDTIRQIFERNETLLTTKENMQNSARSLVTKMVNALTAKLEIGSPMASMYLLGNPDHYTSHEFVNFYWRSFVREACSVFSTPLEDIDNMPEKVMLNKSRGKFVALSNVHDYIYRPSVFGSVNLYDWIRSANKKRKSNKQHKEDIIQDDVTEHADDEDGDNTDSEDELDIIGDNKFIGGGNKNIEASEESESDWVEADEQLEDLDDELNIDENVQYKEDNTRFYSFLPEHPQYNTHEIQCVYLSEHIVPNFIGGTLPRCDQGDHEYYCSTMLTLFKPWRTGHDLKGAEETWEQAFNEYIFSPAQKILMSNFNLRYECLDARDDYSAKMKDNNKEDNKFWETPEDNPLDQEYTGWKDNDEDLNDEMYLTGSCRQNDTKEEEMRQVEQIVAHAGWLDESPDGINKIDSEGITPTVDKSGTQWSSLIQLIRKMIVADRSKNLPTGPNKQLDNLHGTDKVFVDTMMSYLSQKFVPDQPGAINVLESVVQNFKLNTEQERAFRIVANHATINNPTQLKMYLGGMGGTGKSQVLKALVEFFKDRNESHRIIIIAPTGSAAALLNGSTYHSVLNIGSDRARNDATSQINVRERLDGVDYIFLDEISMVACHELYQISASLAKARNMTETPFGGLNMIFAGDFAQLKPVFGSPLYSHTVGTSLDASMSVRSQQSAIGKALWHQVTTVVILRQNMRQKSQSSEDARFRTALENMRYAQCTQDDIEFLKTRIAGKDAGQPNIAKKRFRNVSIITELNSQKDQLNKLGSLRFAMETGQKLTDFYSDDELGEDVDPSTLSSVRKKDKKSIPSSRKHLSPDMQDAIWNLRHSASEHIPGRLSLCMGLPVMIRNNDATELCITKGQEGHIVGWKSGIGPRGQMVLETLFVKLDRPAKNINIEGLPENVVPLMKIKKSVKCTFPNGVSIPIRRSQVQVLPNFAMTVYSSQGKTRPDNVVILNSCRDHLSYYTALSRSATAEGTIIVQGFNPNKITCGAHGSLRQEFRELELMDEITRLRFEDKLSSSINGHLRNALIRQYQKFKGEFYVPDVVPDTLKWTKSDPMNILKVQTDTQWQLIEKFKEKATKYTPASGTVAIGNNKSIKRKADEISSVTKISKDRLENNLTDETEEISSVTIISNKRPKTNLDIQNQDAPVGLIWDSCDHSCAYDAVFTILGDIWLYDPNLWTGKFGLMSSFAGKLGLGFQQVLLKQKTFEDVRDSIRILLRNRYPVVFPYGTTGVDISDLLVYMFTGKAVGKLKYNCTECGTSSTSTIKVTSLFTITRKRHDSIQEHIDANYNKMKKCSNCGKDSSRIYKYDSPLCFQIIGFTQNSQDIDVSKTITLKPEACTVTLPVRGVIYYTGNHFVSRIISPTGEVWYHDGIETKRQCVREGHLTDFTESSLRFHGNKKCVGVVYAV
jgi:Helitron helicase-like domain at N-terminus/PIF1-like helicase